MARSPAPALTEGPECLPWPPIREHAIATCKRRGSIRASVRNTRCSLLNLREHGPNRHADGVPASITTDADTLIPVRIAGLRHANVVCTTLIESRQMTATISSAHRKCIELGVRAEGNYDGGRKGASLTRPGLSNKVKQPHRNVNQYSMRQHITPLKSH